MPILNMIRLKLKKYVQELYDFIDNYDIRNIDEIESRSKLNEMQLCNEIVIEINSRMINKDILRYIAPYFILHFK